MSQTAMDAAAFSEMKELMGDSFKDIISLCLQTLPEQLNDIEVAIKENNAKTLFHVSHKMKSACGSIGAFGLAENAEKIEIIGRNGSANVPQQTLAEFRNAVDQVVTVLKTELES
ncbi:MAG: Hpt domain-containing protein [Gammaproteobacteria bacterium]|nr:Hpt domain-containing protein [Gammaproteobacteria bacterium]